MNNNNANIAYGLSADCAGLHPQWWGERSKEIYLTEPSAFTDPGSYVPVPNTAKQTPETGLSCEILSLSVPVTRASMKTYEEIISYDCLKDGLRKSCKGVMWKDSVANYRLNAVKNTWKLRQDLLNGIYQIQAYHVFHIAEPKVREIVATRLRDRQFQRSLCDNYLYEAVTKGFIHDNCACQIGKGVSFAHKRMGVHLRRYFNKHGKDGWVLQCDIAKFFPSTPHETAKKAIRKRVKDDAIYQHIENIIDSFGGDHGIGLGSQASQLVELAILDDLDHFIKERLRIKHYIRYMDDFILIHQDRSVLENALQEIRGRVEALGLKLNHKTHIFTLKQGIKFLRWRYLLTDSGKIVRRMDRRSIIRERRKIKKFGAKIGRGEIPERKLTESYSSWCAHAKQGNTNSIIRNMNVLYCETLQRARKELQNEQNCF